MGFRKSSSKREVYSNAILPQETRKASYRQPNSTSETAGGKKNNNKTQKIQSQQKETNHKDQSRKK